MERHDLLPVPADQSVSLGTVYLAGMPGTPVGRFDFLVDAEKGAHVEIGTPVAAQTAEGVLVGTVVDMRTVGRGLDPMQEASSSSWHPERVGYLPEAVVATVQVYNAERMRPVRSGTVRAATAEEVLDATGYAGMKWPIPAGAVPLLAPDGTPGPLTKVCMDGTFLLGPTGQGIIVAGRSGVASKTSFMTMLVRSAIAHGNDDTHKVGALLFNVKGDDLVYLDRPTADDDFSATDQAIYDAMGVPAGPFDDVEVYAPAELHTGKARSSREDAYALRWDLKTVWDGLRHFWPDMYSDEKLGMFVAQFRDAKLYSRQSPIDTFAKLDRWFEEEIGNAEGAGSDTCWNGQLHVATAKRLRRKFSGLQSRGRGLFYPETAGDDFDVPVIGWRHGQVVVVDIAGLEPDVQAFVIARTVDRIMKTAESGELGVDHLAICADELNQWAPSQGGELGQVKSTLKKVATQGRFAGLGLFGAAQSASRIDPLLLENCASKAVGSSAETELTSGVHGKLPAGLLERLATMPNGEMALWHTRFRQAVVVRFPRPAWQTGKVTTSSARNRKNVAPKEILAEHVGEVRAGRLLEGVTDAAAISVLSSTVDTDEAVAKLAELRTPDMTKAALHARRTVDPTDPFDLGD